MAMLGVKRHYQDRQGIAAERSLRSLIVLFPDGNHYHILSSVGPIEILRRIVLTLSRAVIVVWCCRRPNCLCCVGDIACWLCLCSPLSGFASGPACIWGCCVCAVLVSGKVVHGSTWWWDRADVLRNVNLISPQPILSRVLRSTCVITLACLTRRTFTRST